jgi:HK97 family phage prohead protease
MKFEQKSEGGVEHISCGLIEVKSESDGEMTFSGYGAVFGNLDAKGDVIEQGAFADTIAYAKSSGNWPAMLSQHGGEGLTADDMTPIGIYTDLREDSKGLYVEGKFAPTQRGQEMHALMKMRPRPAINALSIGYKAIKYKMGRMPEEPRRILQQVKLIEISPVTFPANRLALINNVKSEVTIRTAERALRDAGFSQTEAKRIISHGFKASTAQRDVGGLDEIAETIRRNIQSLTSTRN